ncbi:MAG: hypothetical protein ACK4P5_03655 [Fimbriimonadales bacterium]
MYLTVCDADATSTEFVGEEADATQRNAKNGVASKTPRLHLRWRYFNWFVGVR